MNIAHDHRTCQTGHAHCADDGFMDLQTTIDWQSLRSRLFAAHEVNAALTAASAKERIRLRGSFDGCAASVLTTYEAVSRPVNPSVSSNGKPIERNIGPVAAMTRTGGRG